MKFDPTLHLKDGAITPDFREFFAKEVSLRNSRWGEAGVEGCSFSTGWGVRTSPSIIRINAQPGNIRKRIVDFILSASTEEMMGIQGLGSSTVKHILLTRPVLLVDRDGKLCQLFGGRGNTYNHVRLTLPQKIYPQILKQEQEPTNALALARAFVHDLQASNPDEETLDFVREYLDQHLGVK